VSWRRGPRRPRWPRVMAALLASAASSACGDDLAALDAGAPADDARPPADAMLVGCSPGGDAGTEDGADAGGADCAGEPLTPLCDPARNVCVECLTASDCERAGSFGPSCSGAAGYCRCEIDDDCAGNENGPYCNEDTRACTCLLDSDCADDEECELEPYLGLDVRTCRPRE